MRALIFAFAIALVAISVQVAWRGIRVPQGDELIYLKLADDLTRTATFTNAQFESRPNDDGSVRPGRFFAPAYPILLSGVALVNGDARAVIQCYAERGEAGAGGCRGSPVAVIAAQVVLAAIQAVCIFAIALGVAQSPAVAWLAFAIVLASGYPADMARHYLAENMAFLGFYGFLALLVWATNRASPIGFGLAGAALGLAVLSRPSYAILLYVVPIVILAVGLARWRSGAFWRSAGSAAAFAAAALVVLGPWMMRNVLEFGDPALSSGYAGFIFVQRLAYNEMTVAEGLIAFLYWIPKYGSWLTERLFAPEFYERLTWHLPNSFYIVGNSTLRQETLAAAGGPAEHFQYLLDNLFWTQPITHALVSLPLSWRGIWLPRTVLLSLAGIVLFIPAAFSMASRKRLGALMVVFGPIIFMVGLHGFVSVNNARYNIPILSLYALVIAWSVLELWRLTGAHRQRQKSRHNAPRQPGQGQ